MQKTIEFLARDMGRLFKRHPWHGVFIGDRAPHELVCYIEVVSTDTVKYELDKASGLLRVDRPQKYSNVCPTLYGLIPQTYCAERVADLTCQRTGRTDTIGDMDPLDICVLTEKVLTHGNCLLTAIPIGGLRMIDGNEADDKIIAVMKDDRLYGHISNIHGLPSPLIDRLKHYFLTYKEPPEFLSRTAANQKQNVEITDVYDRDEAFEVIQRSQEDYQSHYGNLSELLKRIGD